MSIVSASSSEMLSGNCWALSWKVSAFGIESTDNSWRSACCAGAAAGLVPVGMLPDEHADNPSTVAAVRAAALNISFRMCNPPLFFALRTTNDESIEELASKTGKIQALIHEAYDIYTSYVLHGLVYNAPFTP